MEKIVYCGSYVISDMDTKYFQFFFLYVCDKIIIYDIIWENKNIFLRNFYINILHWSVNF
jgi:hypothetical protein